MRSAILIALRIGRTETRLGRHDEAAAILDEALAASREHRFDDGVCAALVNLGFLSTAEGRVAEGAGHLRRAAAFARRQGLPEEEMRALLELSRSLATTEGPGPALTLVDRQAARLRERVGIRWQLELDSRRGALLEALVRHEEALKLIQDTDREAKAAGLLRLRLDTLPNGADCYLALGRADSALDWFEQAAAVWEAERELPPEPEWREERGSRGRRIYTALASLLLGPPPGPYSNDRVGEAFDALQRFKALTLRERMLGPAFDRAGAPGEDRSDGNASIINLARLQEEVLHDGELLIDVCLGPEISLLFAVTGETCRAVRLAGEEAGLRKRLKLLHARFSAVPEAGAAVDEAAHDQVCGQLSQLLFGEISDLVAGCDRILFVPDGLLTLVPTGALYGSPGATGSPQRLIFDKETARVPSASILADVRRGGAVHRSAERGVLAVGTGGGRLAGRGPAAPAEEIEWLASRYEEVDTRVSDGAGPPRLTGDDLTHYDVLHIAAPTEWDDRHPWRSGILISSRTTTEDEEDEAAPPAAARATPGGGGMPEAGAATLLRASSIASLDLHARLAALTGCEPAASRILSGEGALALPSAFMNAGVLAIVACLWPVDALATERAMMSFYEHLAGGATAAAALREAKLALLADSRFQEPHYWAGLVLVGDGATRIDLVEQPRPQSALRWTILLLLAVLLMAWIWSRRSATSRGRAGQAG